MFLTLTACSSAPDTKQTKKGPPEPPGAAVATGKHPLNKYVEVMGFRISEEGKGKLKITFGVINHSDADIGDLGMKIKLTTTAAKPEDPPVAEFEAKFPGFISSKVLPKSSNVMRSTMCFAKAYGRCDMIAKIHHISN